MNQNNIPDIEPPFVTSVMTSFFYFILIRRTSGRSLEIEWQLSKIFSAHPPRNKVPLTSHMTFPFVVYSFFFLLLFFFYDVTARYWALVSCSACFEPCNVLFGEVVSSPLRPQTGGTGRRVYDPWYNPGHRLARNLRSYTSHKPLPHASTTGVQVLRSPNFFSGNGSR